MRPSERIEQISREMNQRDLDEHMREHPERGLLQFRVPTEAIVAYLDETLGPGQLPVLPKIDLPRGIVAVETDGRIELWFTGEVIWEAAPFHPEAEYYPADAASWSQVERWRFKP